MYERPFGYVRPSQGACQANPNQSNNITHNDKLQQSGLWVYTHAPT